jgi:PKD repeat protein
VQPATSPNIIGPSASCANATEQFSLSSSYPINTVYQWSLNPANAGTIVSQNGGSVQIEWGNNAPQNVSLSVSFQACGSVLGSTKVVSLNSVPLPFVTQIGTFCKGGSVQLQVSGGTFANINWTGPNNFSGNGNSINITEEGLYQVIVVDASGCLARTQYNASYVTGPIAKISTFDFTTFCAGSSYSVNLCALGNDDYLYSWSNGQTGQCSAVTSAANYAVTITDASNGCTSVSNIIDVSEVICSGGSGPGIPINPSGPSCLPPTGTVSFNYTNCNPINFVNNSVNASNFAWQFGDDSTSTQTNPSHQYAEAGYYLAFLLGDLASNNGSGSCRFFDTAHVVVPLLAIFDVSSSCFGEPICFTDKSVFTFGNDITNWSWDFGDGTIANTRNYCNTYTTPGTYIVTLTVSNSTCATSVSDTIIVSAPPIASFNAPSNACVNTLLNFSNTSTGNTTSWNWDFGNNGTSLKQNPTYTYDAIGTYNVSFVAGNNYGCTDTLTSAITISSPNLSGAITAFPDTIVCPGEEILLSAPTCGNCTYLWSDGSNGSTLTVTSSGNYKLTINDANNCPYITAKSVTVRNVPNATIIYSNTVLCNSVELSTNRSNNFTYYWTANDGVNNGKTTSSISGTLPGGTYIYQLIVTDTTTGCVDTSQPVNITVVPFAAPTITEISSGPYCEDDFVTLVASHPDTSVTFVWDYSHPGDTYVGNLWYQNSFQVVATNNYGCVRSATEYFSAGPHNLTSNFYEGCLDTCQGFVIKGPSGSASYQWLLNGNTIAGATDSTYLPTQNGAYSVIVATDFGCVDTTGVMELTLRECPDLCLNAGPEGSVAVLEAGLKAFPDSMTYQWTLGPPNYTVISGATNQLFTPSGSDTYCAIITNGLGCKDTVCAAWVGIEGIQALEWNLFPNPNNGKFTINVGSHTNETVEIRVVNTLGEIVISRPLELSDHKSSSYVLDVNVASGIYFVQLISVNGAYTRRVVIE